MSKPDVIMNRSMGCMCFGMLSGASFFSAGMYVHMGLALHVFLSTCLAFICLGGAIANLSSRKDVEQEDTCKSAFGRTVPPGEMAQPRRDANPIPQPRGVARP